MVIPEKTLTEIEVRRPDLSELCGCYRWARKPWTRRKFEEAILEALRTPPKPIQTDGGKAA